MSSKKGNEVATDGKPRELQRAAFLGVSWIELMVCLNLILGIYLFRRMQPNSATTTHKTTGIKCHA